MVAALSIFIIAWIVGQYWFIDYWRNLKKKQVSKDLVVIQQKEDERFNELSAKMENEFVKISAQMAVTKALVDNLNNENTFLKEKNDLKDKNLLDAQALNDQLKAKNDELNKLVGDAKNEVVKANAQNDVLAFKNETLEKAQKDKDNEIKKLKDSLEEKTKSTEKIEKDYDKIGKEKAELEIKLNSMVKDLKNCEKYKDESDDLKKRIKELEALLEKSNKKLAIFESVYASIKEDINEI